MAFDIARVHYGRLDCLGCAEIQWMLGDGNTCKDCGELRVARAPPDKKKRLPLNMGASSRFEFVRQHENEKSPTTS